MANERQFGDFQTPQELSTRLCDLLLRRGVNPRCVVEPTCGKGSFLLAAAKVFDSATVLGYDINREHLATAREQVEAAGYGQRVEIAEANVFTIDWRRQLESAPSPLLVIGNPPWVTSADMRRLDCHNLPTKSNLKSLKGIDAITGSSNFDISEWILISLLEGLRHRPATVAMLCKKAVARRVVEYAEARGIDITFEGFWTIEAQRYFGASVSAGFFVFHTQGEGGCFQCDCLAFDDPERDSPVETFGVVDGLLLSDIPSFTRWRTFRGQDSLRWRSGIKHDCAKVMELVRVDEGQYRNGLGEELRIEDECLYPLVKSGDILRHSVDLPERRIIVTQHRVGEPTASLEEKAPRTWQYLRRHKERLDRRASSIYSRKPEFSIFGIGPYSFFPHKVVISGLSKDLWFEYRGPIDGKPIMADDTCYFLGFREERHARATKMLLMSAPAQEFLRSLMFADAKRPVTKRLLDQLHLGRLARWALEHDVDRSTAMHTEISEVAELAESDGGHRLRPPRQQQAGSHSQIS